MRKLIYLFILFCFSGAAAQEGLTPLFPEQDSTELAAERQIMYHQLLNGTFDTELFSEPVQLPEFNFQQELMKRWSYNPETTFHQVYFNGFHPSAFGFFPSPFYSEGAVFSQEKYQLSDKFVIGGFSYGANSLFSAPLPGKGINDFDTRGATMFMQYKVSKNFKIETRVSVQQGPGPGF